VGTAVVVGIGVDVAVGVGDGEGVALAVGVDDGAYVAVGGSAVGVSIGDCKGGGDGGLAWGIGVNVGVTGTSTSTLVLVTVGGDNVLSTISEVTGGTWLQAVAPNRAIRHPNCTDHLKSLTLSILLCTPQSFPSKTKVLPAPVWIKFSPYSSPKKLMALSPVQ